MRVVGQALHAERHGVAGGGERARGSAVVAEFVEAAECRDEGGGAMASGGVVVGAHLDEQFDLVGEAGDQAARNGVAQRVERAMARWWYPRAWACSCARTAASSGEVSALIAPVLTTTQSERPGTQ